VTGITAHNNQTAFDYLVLTLLAVTLEGTQ
jgi:hypothetical protein